MALPMGITLPVITRVDIAWACVATNDGNPLHLDPEYAEKAGFKDVVVPGHFLIGWVGEYLENWCGGAEWIFNWRMRFTAPVWPGDQLTLQGALSESASSFDATTIVTVTATSHRGIVVGIATAELQLREQQPTTT